jgi:hypothetical protein
MVTAKTRTVCPCKGDIHAIDALSKATFAELQQPPEWARAGGAMALSKVVLLLKLGERGLLVGAPALSVIFLPFTSQSNLFEDVGHGSNIASRSTMPSLQTANCIASASSTKTYWKPTGWRKT